MDDSDSLKSASRYSSRSESDTYALACQRAEAGNIIRDTFVRYKEQFITIRNDLDASSRDMESKLIEAYRGTPGATAEDVISTQDPATLLILVKDDELEEARDVMTMLALQPLLAIAQGLRRPVGRMAHLTHECLLDFPRPFTAEDLDFADDTRTEYPKNKTPEDLRKITGNHAGERLEQLGLICEQWDIAEEFIEKFNQTLTSKMKDDKESWKEYAAILSLSDPRGHDKGTWEESLTKVISYHQRKNVEDIEKVCQKLGEYKKAICNPKQVEDLRAALRRLDQCSDTLSE